MANAVAEGMKEAGADVSVMTATEAASLDPSTYDGLAFGCPAMGSEVLEESEFQPMWDDVKGKLSGKSIVLLALTGGAPVNGWTTGKMMLSQAELRLPPIPLILNGSPDDAGLTQCKELGKVLA